MNGGDPLPAGALRRTGDFVRACQIQIPHPYFRIYTAEARPPIVDPALPRLLVIMYAPAIRAHERTEQRLVFSTLFQPLVRVWACRRLEVAASAAFLDATPRR